MLTGYVIQRSDGLFLKRSAVSSFFPWGEENPRIFATEKHARQARLGDTPKRECRLLRVQICPVHSEPLEVS